MQQAKCISVVGERRRLSDFLSNYPGCARRRWVLVSTVANKLDLFGGIAGVRSCAQALARVHSALPVALNRESKTLVFMNSRGATVTLDVSEAFMKSARRTICGTAIAAVLSTSSLGWAADYYFDSVAGDDGNAGTSEDSAKQTFAAPRGSGNTIYLKRGSSWSMSPRFSNVTVKTYGSGARPLFNGSMSVDSSIVEGVAARPTSGNGVNVQSNSTVRDCEVDGSAGGTVNVGFGIMGENNKIIGNIVHDLGFSQSGGSMNNSGGAEGYMVMASNNEVAFNSAINCQSVNETLGGFEGGCFEIVNGKAGSTISNVSFHHNYCEKSVGLWEGCSGDFSQNGGGIQTNHGIIENVTVSYNIAVDSMWLFLLQPVNTDFRNVVFANNTIIHTPRSAEYWDSGGGHFSMALAVATDTVDGTTYETDNAYYKKSGGFQPGTIIVKNNIFVDDISSSRNMMFLTNLTDHSNNIFVPSNASVGSVTLGDSEKKVNLADLAFSADYRLTADSTPAIDQGTTVDMGTSASVAGTAINAGIFQAVFNQDIDGHGVPCGSAPDVGASEYCAGSGGSSSSSPTSVGGGGSTSPAANGGGGSTLSANNGGDNNSASPSNGGSGDLATGPSAAGVPTSAGANEPGCSCRTAGRTERSAPVWLGLAACLLGLARVRRRAR